MIEASIAYRQHFRNSSAALIKATLELNDGTEVKLYNNDFMENTCKFTSDSCDSTFTVGGAVASSFEFSLYNEDGRWDYILDKLKKAWIVPYIGYGSVLQTDEPLQTIITDSSGNNVGVVPWNKKRPIEDIVNLTKDTDGNILYDENDNPMCYTVVYTQAEEWVQKGRYILESAETTGDIVKCKGLDVLSLLEYPYEDFIANNRGVGSSWHIPAFANSNRYTTNSPFSELKDKPYAGPICLALTILDKTLTFKKGEYEYCYCDDSLWKLTQEVEPHYAVLYPAYYYSDYDYPTNPYKLLNTPRETFPRSLDSDFKSVTCLDMIRWIGQLYGCFITTDNRGFLTFRCYDVNAFDELNSLDGGRFDKGYPVDINEYETGDSADGGRFRCWANDTSLEGGRFKEDSSVKEDTADDGEFSSSKTYVLDGGDFSTNLKHKDCDNGWCKGYNHNEAEWQPNDRQFVICDDYSSISIDVEGVEIDNVAVTANTQPEVFDLSPYKNDRQPYHVVEFTPSKQTYIATSNDNITGSTISIADNVLIQGLTIHPNDELINPRGFSDDYRHTGKNMAERILGQYQGMKIYTFNVTTFGDPTVEAGDPILIIDRHNRAYKTYITHINYTVGGGATFSTTAPGEYTESSYVTKNTYTAYCNKTLQEARESYSKNELGKLFKEGDTIRVSYTESPSTYLGGNWNYVSRSNGYSTWKRGKEDGSVSTS